MISLGIVPLARRQNLCYDLSLVPLPIRLLSDIFRSLLLLLVMEEDCASVLTARVWTLSVRSRRIVHLVEELKELSIRNLVRIEHYL